VYLSVLIRAAIYVYFIIQSVNSSLSSLFILSFFFPLIFSVL
jgi:hypothetical protein